MICSAKERDKWKYGSLRFSLWKSCVKKGWYWKRIAMKPSMLELGNLRNWELIAVFGVFFFFVKQIGVGLTFKQRMGVTFSFFNWSVFCQFFLSKTPTCLVLLISWKVWLCTFFYVSSHSCRVDFKYSLKYKLVSNFYSNNCFSCLCVCINSW